MINLPQHLPNVWGAGELLAFSGVDGFTDWNEPFVLHTDAEPGSFVVRLPWEARIAVRGLGELACDLVLGDAVVGSSAAGRFACAFLDHHTFIGELPSGATVSIDGETLNETLKRFGAKNGLELFGITRGRRWTLLLGRDNEDHLMAERCRGALMTDMDELIEQRAAFVAGVPAPAGIAPDRERLLRKAAAVMKVNIEAPCGNIPRRWTTPDRWPHRHIWLWDSAFHAVGLSRIDTALAQDAILAMLEQIREDGLLPHTITPQGPASEITQPPILAWATLEVLQQGGDVAWARQCLPYLSRYLDWIRCHRDRNDNGIPEWWISGDVLCRSGESGLDNSPRFDRATALDAVDFGSFLTVDYRCLAELATRLGESELAASSTAYADRIAAAINELLWSESAGLYLDRGMDGALSPVKAVSGFLPLYAGIADVKQAEALRRHLRNPATFGAPFPVPSVSLDSGTYCKDMWRGPSWLNLTYLIYLGLRRYRFTEDAAALRTRVLDEVDRWYCAEGCLFEYYDSLAVTSPRDLDRKQRLISGKGIAPISDYHWTAAVTALLIFDEAAEMS